MRVVERENEVTIYFVDLAQGKAFKEDGVPYLKMQNVMGFTSESDDIDQHVYNAVSLVDGSVVDFNELAWVIPLDDAKVSLY